MNILLVLGEVSDAQLRVPLSLLRDKGIEHPTTVRFTESEINGLAGEKGLAAMEMDLAAREVDWGSMELFRESLSGKLEDIVAVVLGDDVFEFAISLEAIYVGLLHNDSLEFLDFRAYSGSETLLV